LDAVRLHAPGGKLKPDWVPMIYALANAMGLPGAADAPGDPDPELIAALKKDEGLRLKTYPDPLSPCARTGKGSATPYTIGTAERPAFKRARLSLRHRGGLIEDAREHNLVFPLHASCQWRDDEGRGT